MKVRK